MPRLKKLIVALIEENKKLREQLAPETIRKAMERDEIVNDLSKISVSVEKINEYVDEKGNKCLRVHYSIQPQDVTVFDDGDILCKDQFRLINKLNLLSLEDQEKISTEIEKLQKK